VAGKGEGEHEPTPHRRAGGLYEGLIAGDALVLQERRAAFNVEPVSGFSRAEAEPLRQEVGE
jgi:hypothetical protein